GDATYRAGKKAEVIEELAIRKAYGYDDPVVNAALEGKNNNDVKAVFARLDEPANELPKYQRNITMFGANYSVFSKQLNKELTLISRATPEERAKIARLAEAEDDADRDAVIAGDKAFARRAFQEWKIIQKAYYESI
ncbi:MAG: hypothetical protein MI867_04350, partial [Pseudomonadales bacterium]|nr:hypothetical protein [Pseudomonadales bacterium]